MKRSDPRPSSTSEHYIKVPLELLSNLNLPGAKIVVECKMEDRSKFTASTSATQDEAEMTSNASSGKILGQYYLQ